MCGKAQVVCASIVGIATVAAIAGISSIDRFSSIGAVLLPGVLLAAIVFPQGVEGDQALVYLILAGLIDAALLGLLALFIIRIAARRIRH